VIFHQAPYSSADHPNDPDVVGLRENFTPILSTLGINLVLNGHDHDYARSYLMNGTTAEPGTRGSTLKAGAGGVLYIATNSSSGGKFYPLTGPYPWVAVGSQENVPNYSRVSVNRDEITVSTYRSSDGSTVDQVTLKK
jgi:3',5'-cyclic AMP phosphodiesterase CpdA